MRRTGWGHVRLGVRKTLSATLAVAMLLSLVGPVGMAFADVPTEILIAYPSFEAENTAGLELSGAAALAGGTARLTPAAPAAIGRMFTRQKVHLTNSGAFSTHFAFRITERDGDHGGADGFAFVMKQTTSQGSWDGFGQGYHGLPGESLAVEFDTYYNSEWDPDDNHIGLAADGSATSAIAQTSPPFDMSDGGVKYVWVDYTNEGVLEVRVDETDVRPETPLISESLALPCLPDGATEGDVYVGFTAATGGGYENHDILNWHFENSFLAGMDPGSQSYVMGTASLVGAAEPSMLEWGETSTVTFTATDASGTPLAGECLALSAPQGGDLSTATAWTDSMGNAVMTFTAPGSGEAWSVRAETTDGWVGEARISAPRTHVAGTLRASVDPEGAQGEDENGSFKGSRDAHVSGDGRFVVFYTGNGLADEDTNGTAGRGQDWYRKDTVTGATELVSVGFEGAQSNSGRPSYTRDAAISADGRFVAFTDFSTNLVADDTNGVADVFYRDMELGVTSRISVDASGTEGSYGSRTPAMSADGRFVAFRTGSALVEDDTNGIPDIYVRDVVEGTIERVSVATDGTQGDGYCDEPDISADGRFVTFSSGSSNLVEGDGNFAYDVFVHDRSTGETTRASVDSEGMEGGNYSYEPRISGDGRYVVFTSDSVFVADDDEGRSDIYVRDREAGSTVRVSHDETGENGSGGRGPDISDDGRIVTYSSHWSEASLIRVHDTKYGVWAVASVSDEGENADGYTWGPEISGDGKKVAYSSYASNLVADDTNGTTDVFVATIVPMTRAPYAAADDYSTAEDTTLTVGAPGVLEDDAHPEGEPITAQLQSDAGHGTLSLESDGSFTYRPDLDFHGTDSFTYTAFDGTEHSVPATVQIVVDPVIDATALLTESASATLSAYGDSYTFKGRLMSGTSGVSGEPVTLQSALGSASFSDTSMSTTTGADGKFAIVVKPSSATRYRAVFAGNAEYIGSTSPGVRVLPRAGLTNPSAPSVMYATVPVTVTGMLKPAHAAGTSPVRIYTYRKVAGVWKRIGYVKATASAVSGGSRYAASVSLPSAGSWRLRAYAPADAEHAASWSPGYDYVTVKTRGEQAVAIAKSLVGTPYQWGGNGPDAFDSSGFVRYVYGRMGVWLPRTASQQYLAGPRVPVSDLKPGDLVFYYSPISHVGIYIGNGLAIDCNHRGGEVGIRAVYPGLTGATRPWVE